MEQKDLDTINKFEAAKNRTLQRIGITFFIALVCCSVYILGDVIVNGIVAVTLPYFIKKFSFAFIISFVAVFASFYDLKRKYKKLKEKE